MAAGEGRRLRPLTACWAKPVLPIDGRPVIATLLRELGAAGLRDVTVVVGHLREHVERLLGDGRAFGVAVRYAIQPSADGSADAVARALTAGASPPCLVSAADTVFEPGSIAATARAFAERGSPGAIGVRSGLAPTPGKPGVVVANGRVLSVYDLNPSLPLTSAPLWALGHALVPFLSGLPGPPFELKDAYQRAIDAGLEVLALPVGTTRDLTDPVDLVQENFPYLRGIE
jgi:UDP-N-acetylglucosamine diphosphorylase / glucose-1-phosphate thymidylyltransferase / UDP-N-acetylgalactosamine diphosphorylase / glucosamine-1-phosphate N-acetyltransferase / galactosamine-1-phosphate N-acetyltransferase